jgi:hypothetical protein
MNLYRSLQFQKEEKYGYWETEQSSPLSETQLTFLTRKLSLDHYCPDDVKIS